MGAPWVRSPLHQISSSLSLTTEIFGNIFQNRVNEAEAWNVVEMIGNEEARPVV